MVLWVFFVEFWGEFWSVIFFQNRGFVWSFLFRLRNHPWSGVFGWIKPKNWPKTKPRAEFVDKSWHLIPSKLNSEWIAVADPGFPVGGRRPPRAGRQLPKRLCLENFVCQNERFWTLKGACPDPRSANGLFLFQHIMLHYFSQIQI